jgi:hypothetical protein
MIKTLSILLSAVAISASAQTTATTPVQTPVQPQPAVPPNGVGQRILLPNQPSARTQVNPVFGVATNNPANARNALQNQNSLAVSNAMVYSNLFGATDMNLNQVAGGLQTLQQNIEQLLPALASLSGSFGGNAGTTATGNARNQNKANVGAANVGAVNPGATAPPVTTTAPSQNSSRVSPMLPASPFLRGTGNPNQVNQAMTPTGQTQVQGTAANGQPIIGTLGSDAFQTDAQTRRMLIALQNDLQQALPILRALNTTTPNSAAQPLVQPGQTQPLTPTSFTGRFNRILQEQDIQMNNETDQSVPAQDVNQ